MTTESKQHWGSSYRLIAAERWKAKSAAMGRAVTEALVKYAKPQPGMCALDLATGTGEPGISIASRVGPKGHVTAVDLSSELLQLAQQRAQARGLTNFTTHQADAHSLPFPDDKFDIATCRFGVMFFGDVERALAELHRVLKPGARACFIAWGPYEQPYWSSTMAVVQRRLGEPIAGPEDMFRFAKPGSLTAALQSAGFSSVDEELKHLPWTWPGPIDEVWEYAQSVSTPFRALLERVPVEQRDIINREVHAQIAKYVQGDNVEFGVQVVMASGSK
jgi:ubiquinone/menaquinone biosynthesis C-methylase UbiE